LFSYFIRCGPPSPTSSLFPYTTLFRSHGARSRRRLLRVPEGRRADRLGRVLPAPARGGARRSGARLGVRRRRRGLGENLLCGRRSEEHTSELQSRVDLVCRLLLEKKKT